MAYGIAQTQTANITTAATSGSIAVSTTTTGNLGILIIATNTGGITYSSVTDGTNTYTLVGNVNSQACYYCANITGVTSPTISFNSSSSVKYSIIFREYTGVQTSSPLDKSTQQSQSGTSFTSGASAATTNATDLVIGWMGVEAAGTITIGSGYSNLATISNTGNSMAVAIEDKSVSSTGTQTATFTNPSAFGCAGVIAFKLVVTGIAYDTSSNSGYKASLSTYSWSHTVGATANPGLIVNVSIFVSGTVTAITYNSVALEFEQANTIGVYRNEIWSLSSPATGANTIAVTFSGVVTSFASADSYTGVDQADCVAQSSGATGSGVSTPTANLTTLDNNSWTVSGLTTSDTTMTVGGSATQRNNQTGALGTGAISDLGPITPVGTAETMTWSAVGTLDSWAMGILELDPFGGTAYGQTVTSTYSASGSLIKRTNRTLTSTYTISGSLIKAITRTLASTYKTVGSFMKTTARLFTSIYSTSGNYTTATGVSLSLSSTYQTSSPGTTCDYLTLQDSNMVRANYAGANSIKGTNVTGWSF